MRNSTKFLEAHQRSKASRHYVPSLMYLADFDCSPVARTSDQTVGNVAIAGGRKLNGNPFSGQLLGCILLHSPHKMCRDVPKDRFRSTRRRSSKLVERRWRFCFAFRGGFVVFRSATEDCHSQGRLRVLAKAMTDGSSSGKIINIATPRSACH